MSTPVTPHRSPLATPTTTRTRPGRTQAAPTSTPEERAAIVAALLCRLPGAALIPIDTTDGTVYAVSIDGAPFIGFEE